MGEHKQRKEGQPALPLAKQQQQDKSPIAVGQIWDGVRVSAKPHVNRLGLTAGAKLPAVRVLSREGQLWVCGFVGERGSQIHADDEMLLTGKVRA